MDPDVALLQSYASYVGGIGSAASTIASNAASLAAMLTVSSMRYASSAQAIATSAGAVNATVANLYAAELGQIAGDLTAAIAGTTSPAASGDPALLQTIATWLQSIDSSLSGVAAAISLLQTELATSTPNAIEYMTAIANADGLIYVSPSMSPADIAVQLNRIATRMSGLLALAKTGTVAPPPPAAAKGSNDWIYASVGLAAVVGSWWLIKKGHLTSRKSRSR